MHEQSYSVADRPGIHVRVHPTRGDIFIEPDPDRNHAWHAIMETSDVDVTLSTSDIATFMQTMRTVYEMCSELEDISRRVATTAHAN